MNTSVAVDVGNKRAKKQRSLLNKPVTLNGRTMLMTMQNSVTPPQISRESTLKILSNTPIECVSPHYL